MWVFLGIVAIIALILCFSLTVYVEIKEEISVFVGVAFYKHKLDFSSDDEEDDEKKEKSDEKKAEEEKKAKKGKKAKKSKSGNSIEEAKKKLQEKAPSKNSLGDTVALVLEIMKSALPSVGKLLSHMRFTKIRIKIAVSSEDASKTATEYGAISGGVYALLGALSSNFKVKIKDITIFPDFVKDKPVYDISFCAKLRLVFILAGAIVAGIKVLKVFIKKAKA